MPRTSPYAIRLTRVEAAELQRRATKYTLPYFQVQRAKMVLLAAEGLTNEEIAARLDTRPHTPLASHHSPSPRATPGTRMGVARHPHKWRAKGGVAKRPQVILPLPLIDYPPAARLTSLQLKAGP